MEQQAENRIVLRPVATEDTELLHRWLNLPHVNRWWFIGNKNRTPSLEEVREYWAKRITGQSNMHCHIILVDNKPIGYIQWYRVEPDNIIRNPENVAGIDILIGETGYLYKGLGPKILKQYMDEIIFSEPDIKAFIIDPEPENTSAIRAYEKTGFVYQYTVRDEEHNLDVYIMRIEKP